MMETLRTLKIVFRSLDDFRGARLEELRVHAIPRYGHGGLMPSTFRPATCISLPVPIDENLDGPVDLMALPTSVFEVVHVFPVRVGRIPAPNIRVKIL